MGNSIHRQLLATEPQLELIKTGAAMRTGGLEKRAQILDQITDSATKLLITTSLVTGIPIGIMAHVIGNKVKGKRAREQEMDARIKYYQEAGDSIENALASRGVQY